MNLTHLHLMVKSVDTSVNFYIGILGFKELGRQDDSVILRDENGLDLVIELSDSKDPIPASIHIGFRQKTLEDLKECYKSLHGKVEIIHELVIRKDISIFSFKDPDQMMIEIYYTAF